MGSVKLHAVVTGLLAANCSVDEFLLDALDIFQGHFLRNPAVRPQWERRWEPGSGVR